MSNERLQKVKDEIRRVHKSLSRRNHFDLLGVAQDASAEDVKASYHALAKKWHADNYADLELGALKTKLDEIFQRISDAYETVSDPAQRAEYLIVLQRQNQGLSTDVHAILRAEQLIDEALLDIRRKQWKSAEDKLEEAKQLNPDDPLYDVHLAWATFNGGSDNPKRISRAVETLKGAIKRQESLPLAYQYLGHIAFKSDNPTDAKKWWRKCLEWDEKNVEASRGIRLINTRAQKKQQGFGAIIGKLFGKKS